MQLHRALSKNDALHRVRSKKDVIIPRHIKNGANNGPYQKRCITSGHIKKTMQCTRRHIKTSNYTASYQKTSNTPRHITIDYTRHITKMQYTASY
jgi:hypothetical protein